MTETERREESEPAFGDLALEQEKEMEQHLEMDRDIKIERQREMQQKEEYRLLLRLQEVEKDMEAYAHTASELRAMLEEEEEDEDEDETSCLQTLENLEFCTYTLSTLALEQQHLQQQLQGKWLHLSHKFTRGPQKAASETAL